MLLWQPVKQARVWRLPRASQRERQTLLLTLAMTFLEAPLSQAQQPKIGVMGQPMPQGRHRQQGLPVLQGRQR